MHIANILRIVGAVVTAALLAGTAHAQLFRAYLSPAGLDTNPCTLPAPCRLLPAALAATADGGEIWMLGSANYNTATVDIAKSVSILAVPGVVGSVVASGGPAINIATAGVKVALRNLVITPLAGGGGTDGINMTNGAALTVENCLIANLPGAGIVANAAAIVQVTDTTIRDNVRGLWIRNGANAIVARATITGNSSFGVWIDAGSGVTTTADIAHSTIGKNYNGIIVITDSASGVVNASVHDSQVVQNVSDGMSAAGTPGSTMKLTASNNIVTRNYAGILSGQAATVIASGNTVTDNYYGIFGQGVNAPAVFESSGNNTVRNNTINKYGTITVVATE